ncbi:MAG: M20 family metallopeptidase [Planctomycetota bacterium]|jgi:acetylornithine deacetylase
MTISKDQIKTAVDELLPSAKDFLCGLIEFPSTPGQEHDLMCWAEGEFKKLGAEVERVPMSDSIIDDEDYSSPIPDIKYDGRFNLRVSIKGSGGGKSLVFNSHVDVVPPSQGQDRPFEPQEKDGVIFGRGACDAKGQIASIYLILAVIKKLGCELSGDLIAHVVNEEENGGNGTLAMTRAGEKADACIVMEPTTNKIYSSVRGAVWFRLSCEGIAGHSGRAGDTISALTLARLSMDALEKYHAELLAASKGLPLFDKYENPMPITFGRCHAGDWPATAPAAATVEGVLGLLPNKTRYEVMKEMRAALDNCGDDRVKERVQLEFMYRHDSHVLDPEHELVKGLQEVCGDWEVPVEVDAMTASCDSWFYNNQLEIPSVVYGPGTLGFAHSNHEQIKVSEIGDAACVIADFAIRWSK